MASFPLYSRQPEVPEEKASSPRCAVGVASLLDHKPSPREVTCILCQENSKDFAEEFGSQGRMFVQTVSVQKSTVLRRHKPSSDSKGTYNTTLWMLVLTQLLPFVV